MSNRGSVAATDRNRWQWTLAVADQPPWISGYGLMIGSRANV
jgi:hypothetical protein